VEVSELGRNSQLTSKDPDPTLVAEIECLMGFDKNRPTWHSCTDCYYFINIFKVIGKDR